MTSHRHDLAGSSITPAELQVYRLRTHSGELGKLIELFLAEVPIIAFDARIAKIAEGITTSLMAEGNPIGFADIAIAATAMNIDAVLVSNNLRRFDRIQELEALNWES
jgi:tRNA(fMet)-specific endonuclease VapC